MYTEKLKESVGGVLGSFILKNGKLIESDLKHSPQFVIHSILYLHEAVTERKDLKRVLIFGEKTNFSVVFHPGYVIGVLLTQGANIHLLNLVIRRILEPSRQPPEGPPSLEEQIPFFDRPRGDVLPNVPAYARQVLEFVDGNRTIRDILEQSRLPPEVVWDIILSYRRSSVIHFK